MKKLKSNNVIEKNEKLYKKNILKLRDIISSLNGKNPCSIRRTNQNLYMKYYRATKVIEKITEEGNISSKFIDNIQRQSKINPLSINCNNDEVIQDEISPKSVIDIGMQRNATLEKNKKVIECNLTIENNGYQNGMRMNKSHHDIELQKQ